MYMGILPDSQKKKNIYGTVTEKVKEKQLD